MSGVDGNKKVPAIRFAGFSGEWEVNHLGDICNETYGGGTPSTSNQEFWGQGIPWIQSSDIVENILENVHPRKKITEQGLNKSAAKLIPEYSIAIVTRVGVGKLSLMKEKYATSQDFISLSKLTINILYATYSIWNMLQYEKLAVQGTSIKGITKEELLSKKILYPESKKEQTKIGNYFQQLDTLIAQHQQKHEKLQNIKKALLEKCFPKQGEHTPELRFKGFSGAWDEKALGDVADIVGGGTPSTQISEYWGGDINWYSPTEIGKNVYAEKSEKKITIKGLEKSSARMLPANKTVLFTSRAGIGDMAILVKDGCTNQGFQSFILNEGYDTYFIYSAGFLIKNYSLMYSSGSTFLEISGKQLEKMNMKVPSEKEQTKIGNLFQQLDTLINQQQTQLGKLKNIKQACLEKMFV